VTGELLMNQFAISFEGRLTADEDSAIALPRFTRLEISDEEKNSGFSYRCSSPYYPTVCVGSLLSVALSSVWAKQLLLCPKVTVIIHLYP